MAVFDPLLSDSGPGVDTVGIYVENHHNECREFFIWIRFDNMKLSEKGYLPASLEDPLISETCPLEESASHHPVCHKLGTLPLAEGEGVRSTLLQGHASG